MKLPTCIFFIGVLCTAQCLRMTADDNHGATNIESMRQIRSNRRIQQQNRTANPIINLQEHGTLVEVCHKSYLINMDYSKRTWKQAETKCKSLDLKLVSLQTEEKQNCLNQYFANFHGSSFQFWTSGRDVNRNGNDDRRFVWKSVKSQAMNFTSWADTQPDNKNNKEKCVLATFKNSQAQNLATWTDEKCDLKFRYICE